MLEILEILKSFEKRNNISVYLEIYSDCSGSVRELWDEEVIKGFESLQELKEILENINLKKDEKGLCISPVEILNVKNK